MARTHEKARLSAGSKVRLDTLLVERKLAESRARARAFIMEGAVLVDGTVVDKAGEAVSPDAVLAVRAQDPYVSRGGIKLERALERFRVEARDRVVVDIGSSTGGFTDCWLKHGARLVYAVDVGYGQLATALRSDPRVEVHERTNARYLAPGIFSGPAPSAASMDVSFIDPRLILPALDQVMEGNWELVELVKPQFIVGPGRVGKGGVVRNPAYHADAIELALSAVRAAGLEPAAVIPSPIRGQKGNLEFLLHAVKGGPRVAVPVAEVVRTAWEGERS